MIQEIAVVVAATGSSPRLLDRVRQEALALFGRSEPGERYADWVKRFVLFHQKRHPAELSREDVWRFLVHLSHTDKDPLGGMEQAREALVFLYRSRRNSWIGSVMSCACGTIRRGLKNVTSCGRSGTFAFTPECLVCHAHRILGGHERATRLSVES